MFREYNLQHLQKQAGLVNKRRRDEAAAKNEDLEGFNEEIRSRGRMDAENRWWVTELLAADCEKAWIHPEWEDTMQKWYEWLEKMKKDAKKKMEGNSSTQRESDDQKCGRQCWAFAQNHEAHSMERRSPDLEERRRGC